MSHSSKGGGNRRGRRPVSRNSGTQSSASSSAATLTSNLASRIGRRGAVNNGNAAESANSHKRTKLPSEPDPEQNIYVVECLVKSREPQFAGDERHFLVKWLNYPASQNSWEPESNLSHELVIQWDRDAARQNGESRAHSRAESKLSSENEGSAKKAKKRLLPTSPKQQNQPTVAAAFAQATSASKSASKTNQQQSENGHKSNQGAHLQSSVANCLNKSKMLEVVGAIKPENILAVYRESEGELCYLIERSCSISEIPFSNGAPSMRKLVKFWEIFCWDASTLKFILKKLS